MVASEEEQEEYLQVLIPALTKRQLDIRSAETREPLRMVVLRALDAYGFTVPAGSIADRRRTRKS
ncbi:MULTISPECIES: hypothetical protein [Sinorhizobium]|uniref:hypothetical protein n=1 Tax=Sinorhizobium TaxID=28105 RepID=UPI0003FE295F|nr:MULTISPECIES: hypothetical protein [Sinorhizobium]WOS67045.1 hypothetical protein SFGR64A_32170 [Sinorhizobium fredii GR64]